MIGLFLLAATTPLPAGTVGMTLTCRLTTQGTLRDAEQPSNFVFRVEGGKTPQLVKLSETLWRPSDPQKLGGQSIQIRRWIVKATPDGSVLTAGNGIEGIGFKRVVGSADRYDANWSACENDGDGILSHCGFYLGGEGDCVATPGPSAGSNGSGTGS